MTLLNPSTYCCLEYNSVCSRWDTREQKISFVVIVAALLGNSLHITSLRDLDLSLFERGQQDLQKDMITRG